MGGATSVEFILLQHRPDIQHFFLSCKNLTQSNLRGGMAFRFVAAANTSKLNFDQLFADVVGKWP